MVNGEGRRLIAAEMATNIEKIVGELFRIIDFLRRPAPADEVTEEQTEGEGVSDDADTANLVASLLTPEHRKYIIRILKTHRTLLSGEPLKPSDVYDVNSYAREAICRLGHAANGNYPVKHIPDQLEAISAVLRELPD